MNLSRKELIVIALLLNLGVLSVIVSLATSGKKEEPKSDARVAAIATEPLRETQPKETSDKVLNQPQKEMGAASFDEIDQILEEYIPLDDSIGDKLSKESVVKAETDRTKDTSPSHSKPTPPLKQAASKEVPLAKKSPAKEEKKLVVKDDKKSTSSATTAKQTAAKSNEKVSDDTFYVVQPGDNPWKIAKKFHISFDKLLELNNLNEKRARNLKVGERLKIREEG